jgi:predicted ATPase
MITRIQALNYRCLRYIDQRLQPFQLLVGPNASGKTTFLDVVNLLGDIVSNGVEAAVQNRVSTPRDLTWQRGGDGFEVAIEAEIAGAQGAALDGLAFSHIRYEIAVDMDVGGEGVGISNERVWLKQDGEDTDVQRDFFPQMRVPPKTIMLPKRQARTNQKLIVSKVVGGNDNYSPEPAKGYSPSFKQTAKKSALGNLPADVDSFPASTWLKEFLTQGIQQFVLNSQLIRKASPPGQIRSLKPDGSNIPWVVEHITQTAPDMLNEWIRHLQTALPDLRAIRTVERADDKHRYLMLKYSSGLEVPSWLASDGTLRLLALTLPAYLADFRGAYLIEEPENGIHPKAVETVFQSLSSVYDAQVLLATHSPVLLSLIKPRNAGQVLCFAKTEDGATDIVSGDKHPGLSAWQGAPNLSVLFAGGVLG